MTTVRSFLQSQLRLMRPRAHRLCSTVAPLYHIAPNSIGWGKRVAVLFQKLDPPIINGVRKPKKPGGYQDSGADIAYVLQQKCGIHLVTPSVAPDPRSDEGWCFPDDEAGILKAVHKGATHLWANTILFAGDPLQTSSLLTAKEEELRVVGQPPRLVEVFDDKHLVNDILRSHPGFSLPKATTVSSIASLQENISDADLRFPIVGKPVRGRGSYGVQVCQTLEELEQHVSNLLCESPLVMLEQYLEGQEATITVMPPSRSHQDYWAMPFIVRFNHISGIAPYSGVVAVTKNSRIVSQAEYDNDSSFARIANECVAAAKLLKSTAPIRIDVRRCSDAVSSNFMLFDVNMKPNMTGPGRPGREDQASLTALAAAGLGWDYPLLLRRILETAPTLHYLRNVQSPPV